MVNVEEVKRILAAHGVDAVVVDISDDNRREAFQNKYDDARYAAVYESGTEAAWAAFVLRRKKLHA